MNATIGQLAALLDAAEWRRLAALAALLLASAALEAAGVGFVFVLVSLLQDPSAFLARAQVIRLREASGLNETGFLLAVCAVVFAMFVVRHAVFLTATWVKLSMQWRLQRRIALRLFGIYLRQPLSFHHANNSGALLYNVAGATSTTSVNGYLALCDMFADVAVLAATVALLMWVAPGAGALAIAAGGTVLGLYWLYGRRRFAAWGHAAVAASKDANRAVLEPLAGIKTIKLLGREDHFVSRYGSRLDAMVRAAMRNNALQQVPRVLFEILVVGTILALIAIAVARAADTAALVPLLALFGAAAYRMMPAMVRVTGSMQNLRYAEAAIAVVHADLARPAPPLAADTPAEFRRELRLEGIVLRYPGAERAALDGASLFVQRGAFVAIAGSSGAGKTSLADVLLGLTPRDSGTLALDGAPLAHDVVPPPALFGYVPQETFVIDDTIAANVALGEADATIDRARVAAALSAVAFDDVLAGLPAALDTRVGERGTLLSGGQRQRLGLARALYRDPPILVLDEATSALDGATEAAIAASLAKLRGAKTLVVIAHRLSTIRAADAIHYMENGRTVDVGTFDALIERCPGFARLVELASVERAA
ncbi:MAG: ABC transporter ATP-binding protein/permease [Tagaea sp.]|nr:ABC transporter ATP-binding protein/permease [Tagaea sp.]